MSFSQGASRLSRPRISFVKVPTEKPGKLMHSQAEFRHESRTFCGRESIVLRPHLPLKPPPEWQMRIPVTESKPKPFDLSHARAGLFDGDFCLSQSNAPGLYPFEKQTFERPAVSRSIV